MHLHTLIRVLGPEVYDNSCDFDLGRGVHDGCEPTER